MIHKTSKPPVHNKITDKTTPIKFLAAKDLNNLNKLPYTPQTIVKMTLIIHGNPSKVFTNFFILLFAGISFVSRSPFFFNNFLFQEYA